MDGVRLKAWPFEQLRQSKRLCPLRRFDQPDLRAHDARLGKRDCRGAQPANALQRRQVIK